MIERLLGSKLRPRPKQSPHEYGHTRPLFADVGTEIAPPDSLNDIAADEWRRLAPSLCAAGRLTALDVNAFRVYCELFAETRELKAKLDDEGYVSFGGKNGAPYTNPVFTALNRAREMMNAAGRRFGLDPKSREDLEKPDDDKNKNDPMRSLVEGD